MTEYGDLPGSLGEDAADEPAKDQEGKKSGAGSELDLDGLNLPGLPDPGLSDPSPPDPGSSVPGLSGIPAEIQPDRPQGIDGALESPLPGAGDSPEIDRAAGKIDVPASLSFSLMIEGPLRPEEREKLLDVLARESMGIREVDIEPQLEGGRVLIPRISEYAGILLVQALRNTRARMKLGPSDRVFSAEPIHDSEEIHSAIDLPGEGEAPHPESEPGQIPPPTRTVAILGSTESLTDLPHPAEALPVTAAPSIPAIPLPVVIDTVTASATLTGRTVEVENSPEYQQITDNLQRELKFKAFRKGAEAIVGLKIQLIPLHVPTHYRLLLSGTAVRAKGVIEASGTPLPSADDLGGPASGPGGTLLI